MSQVEHHVPDPDTPQDGGPPTLEVVSHWLFGAGLFLLLPRQWASAGIAFILGGILRSVSRRRSGRPPDSAPGLDAPSEGA